MLCSRVSIAIKFSNIIVKTKRILGFCLCEGVVTNIKKREVKLWLLAKPSKNKKGSRLRMYKVNKLKSEAVYVCTKFQKTKSEAVYVHTKLKKIKSGC